MNPSKTQENASCAHRKSWLQRHTYPCGSWAGLSPQLLPLYPTFFVHFFFSSSPTPAVCAPSYRCIVCESPTRSRRISAPNDGLQLNNPDRVHTSRRRHGNMFIFFLFLPPLYPSGFAFSANPALCSSPRQHPHRHLPLGARLLSSGRLETAVPERGRGFTQRAASRGGNNPGGGEKRVCLTTWSTCTHECRLKKHNNEHKVFLKKKKKKREGV